MTPVDVFFSYSHKDEELREALDAHLSALKRQEKIRTWHDLRIGAGDEWEEEIHRHLDTADLILLLISADFLNSDYCHEIEMKRALERHGRGEARVVPIILRPCDWKTSPFAKLQGLPRGVKPITSWRDRDEALFDVAQGLRALVEKMPQPSTPQPSSFPDDETRQLSIALEQAEQRRAELEVSGAAKDEIRAASVEIRRIKRAMREGGQLKVGDSLAGRYRLHELLGQGGFAQVWKAYDRERKTFVAVKVLHSQYGGDEGRQRRFFRGARQMERLRDVAGIVDVIEAHGQDGGFHFFVMEYVAGGDFRRAVLGRELSMHERLRVVLDVGRALGEAHERGIVHRDVKPANILLDLDGRPKLADFDLVRALDTTGGTRTSSLGTIVYAAPESMLDASEATAAVDIYGLAMTAIFAIHGRDLPLEALLEQKRFIEALEAEQRWCDVLARGVERRVEERWTTAEEFCDALEAMLETAGTSRVIGESEPEIPASGPSRQGQDRVAGDFNPRRGEQTVSPKPGDLWIDPVLGMRFRYVPPGTFLMGSPPDEEGRSEDETQHQVTLSRGFWLGETPVTQGQWRRLMGADPSRFDGNEHPVEQVSWYDAIAFANALSQAAKLRPCYELMGDNGKRAGEGLACEHVLRLGGEGFRLPTEAEWERAARAGTTAARYGKLTWIAWHAGNSGSRTRPVGRLKPNAWSLYDMLGNVYEWCEDRYSDYEAVPQGDPRGPEKGTGRVVRGGSWLGEVHHVRAAARYGSSPSDRAPDLGFRLSRG